MHPVVDSTPLVLFIVAMVLGGMAILCGLYRVSWRWVKAPLHERDYPEIQKEINPPSVHHGALFIFDTKVVHEMDYTNHKGVRSTRHLVPKVLCFGSNTWHPEPQWLLEAYDTDKHTVRTFALNGFH
jgi:hypothetical protein